MKRLLLTLAAFAFLVPSFSFAQTTPTSAPTTTAFSRNLTIGSKGVDVSELQSLLIIKGFSLPAGASGYFGTQTKKALAAYQTANGITPASGYFGSLTRAEINTITSSPISSVQPTTSLQTVSPSVAAKPAGTTSAPVTAPVATSAPVLANNVQVSAGSLMRPYLISGGIYYQFPLTITNGTDSTIYVPTSMMLAGTGTPGFTYSINGNTNGGSISSTIDCSPMSYVQQQTASIQVCQIQANQSKNVNIAVILAPNTSGEDSITLNSMSYASNTNSNSIIWNILPINVTTSSVSSGPVTSGTANTYSNSSQCAQLSQLKSGYSTTGIATVAQGNSALIQAQMSALGCSSY